MTPLHLALWIIFGVALVAAYISIILVFGTLGALFVEWICKDP